jgi:ABC-type Co2+ transport system permease subunit
MATATASAEVLFWQELFLARWAGTVLRAHVLPWGGGALDLGVISTNQRLAARTQRLRGPQAPGTSRIFQAYFPVVQHTHACEIALTATHQSKSAIRI